MVPLLALIIESSILIGTHKEMRSETHSMNRSETFNFRIRGGLPKPIYMRRNGLDVPCYHTLKVDVQLPPPLSLFFSPLVSFLRSFGFFSIEIPPFCLGSSLQEDYSMKEHKANEI